MRYGLSLEIKQKRFIRDSGIKRLWFMEKGSQGGRGTKENHSDTVSWRAQGIWKSWISISSRRSDRRCAATMFLMREALRTRRTIQRERGDKEKEKEREVQARQLHRLQSIKMHEVTVWSALDFYAEQWRYTLPLLFSAERVFQTLARSVVDTLKSIFVKGTVLWGIA